MHDGTNVGEIKREGRAATEGARRRNANRPGAREGGYVKRRVLKGTRALLPRIDREAP